MSYPIPIIPSLKNAKLKNKIVVVRVDFNVPLSRDGKVSENTRIVESIPTIQYLLDHGVKQIHLLSHLGRPKGTFDASFSLEQIQTELEKALGQKVEFRKKLKPGKERVQLYENMRFYPGEKTNDPEFIKELQKLGGEIFVNEGFAVSHRAHASIVGLATFLPSYPGFLLEKEIQYLTPFLSQEKIAGLTVIVGGAKIGTKINVLKHFALTAENILIGGALANTFLAAQGHNVAESMYEPEEVKTAQSILYLAKKNKTKILTPTDVVVAPDIKSPDTQIVSCTSVKGEMKIFDLGPESIERYTNVISDSTQVIWNGPVGCYEFSPFAVGTKAITQATAKTKAETILGGGDTLDAIAQFKSSKSNYTHVSTGGGAMLDFLEGKALPGVECLKQFPAA